MVTRTVEAGTERTPRESGTPALRGPASAVRDALTRAQRWCGSLVEADVDIGGVAFALYVCQPVIVLQRVDVGVPKECAVIEAGARSATIGIARKRGMRWTHRREGHDETFIMHVLSESRTRIAHQTSLGLFTPPTYINIASLLLITRVVVSVSSRVARTRHGCICVAVCPPKVVG